MALRLLKSYKTTVATANVYALLIPAIPANRALVLSKIMLSSADTVVATFYIRLNGSIRLATNIALGVSEVYTETGIVMVAGDILEVYWTGSPYGLHVSAFGEEVDN